MGKWRLNGNKFNSDEHNIASFALQYCVYVITIDVGSLLRPTIYSETIIMWKEMYLSNF